MERSSYSPRFKFYIGVSGSLQRALCHHMGVTAQRRFEVVDPSKKRLCYHDRRQFTATDALPDLQKVKISDSIRIYAHATAPTRTFAMYLAIASPTFSGASSCRKCAPSMSSIS